METKRCNRCGRDLPVTSYYKTGGSKDGLYRWCKDCHRAAARRQWKKEQAAKRLSEMSADDILAELRRRGFVGELRYMVGKILHTGTV